MGLNLPMFVTGLMLCLMSFILYFTQDFYMSQAVNSNTETVLTLAFPLFVIAGIIFTAWSFKGDS